MAMDEVTETDLRRVPVRADCELPAHVVRNYEQAA